jgi:hypothetical protein
MKKFLKLLILPLLILSLVACAGQSTQVTVGKSLLAMHDAVKVSAETANTLCVQKVIPADKCATIKVCYDKFRQAWPIVDDALVTYLKAPGSDTAATTAFNIASATFTKDYTEIMALLADVGVLKGQVK